MVSPEEIVKMLSIDYAFNYEEAMNKIHLLNSLETSEDVLLNISKQEFINENILNNFCNSKYELVDKLKPNSKGNIGEKFLADTCKMFQIPIVYDGVKNKNSSDGTYDIKIYDKRCEVKTACIGKNGSLQHENLRNSGCDKYIFLSIFPNHYYLTILQKFDLNQCCSHIKARPHLRKGTSDVFKFTLTEKHINIGCLDGISIKITNHNDFENIGNFIKANMLK